MLEILVPIIGFIIGLSVMVGLGGGFLVVPLLTLVFAFSPANAVGTSLTVILMTTTVASLYYWRQKQVYYKTGLILGAVAIPGAILGSYLTKEIPGQIIGVLVGVFLIFVAWQIVYGKQDENSCEGKSGGDFVMFEKKLFSQRRETLVIGAVLCFFGGLCGGLLGIPGVLLVPILVFVLRMPFKAVAATSVFMMIFISFAGVIQHLSLGDVNVEYAILLGSGSMFGGLLGAHFCRVTKSGTLRWILSGLLVFVSLLLFLKFGLGFF